MNQTAVENRAAAGGEPPFILWVRYCTNQFAFRRMDGSFAACLAEAHRLPLPSVELWRIRRSSDGVALAEWQFTGFEASVWRVFRVAELAAGQVCHE
jgi:hypothetical protein